MTAILKNYITISEPAKRAAHAQQVLNRLRVIKIFEVEELIMLLSMILSQLEKKKCNLDLRMIVIDSLSSLFAGVSPKQ